MLFCTHLYMQETLTVSENIPDSLHTFFPFHNNKELPDPMLPASEISCSSLTVVCKLFQIIMYG